MNESRAKATGAGIGAGVGDFVGARTAQRQMGEVVIVIVCTSFQLRQFAALVQQRSTGQETGPSRRT